MSESRGENRRTPAAVSARVNFALHQLDLVDLRRRFSDLFDEIARVITGDKLDLDDVIVDRLVVCRLPDGRTVTVPADSLADVARLKNSLIAAVGQSASATVSAEDICITELIAQVRRA